MAQTDNQTVEVPAAALHGMLDVLQQVEAGDLAARVEIPPSGAARDLAMSLNTLLASLDGRTQEMHASSMELALGLSDCFEALSQMRGGNLDARVSPETLQARDELLARFATALNQTLEDVKLTIVRQRSAIQMLSTPVLRVWEDVLALPVIGVVDTQRSVQIMETLLTAIVEEQARYVILDITGVELVDTKTADHFIKVISAAQLLGAQCLLTGIQPAVAQTLVEIGIDLSAVTTLRTLQDGLRECLRRMEQRAKTGGLAAGAARHG